MYVAAFVVCLFLGRLRAGQAHSAVSREQLGDLIFLGIVGTILGGRIGYVVLYGWDQLLLDWLFLFRVWEGGMSFHGGIIGVLTAVWFFCRKHGKGFFVVSDFVAPLVPIGLGLGRLGNFINQELPGRVTDWSVGVHFNCSAVSYINPACFTEWEPVTRHISSLYQAIAEGIVLWLVVWFVSSHLRDSGLVSGVFLLSYGTLRCVTELFRQPDPQLGFIFTDWLTMGQILSVPMIAIGIALIVAARRGLLPSIKPT